MLSSWAEEQLLDLRPNSCQVAAYRGKAVGAWKACTTPNGSQWAPTSPKPPQPHLLARAIVTQARAYRRALDSRRHGEAKMDEKSTVQGDLRCERTPLDSSETSLTSKSNMCKTGRWSNVLVKEGLDVD